ncbi:hypothetical protein T07_306 [Trichinella nelsoni]|uniref:Uncharacterized protein n=1 Tax=Trichinella nelsoni TaxID=6336 RepID=A0A0V0RFJ0_9BILA|nr:hypothetical protein T07_306 [Trichinella nelsoni]
MEGSGRRCAINFLSQMRGFFNHGYVRHASGDTKAAAVSTVPFGTCSTQVDYFYIIAGTTLEDVT